MGILRKTAALRKQEDSGVQVLDIYVAGPNDPKLIKEVMGIGAATLHPCVDCRQLLRDHDATTHHTGIITFGLDGEGVVEHHSLHGLIAKYNGVEVPLSSVQLMETGSLLGATVMQGHVTPYTEA